MSSVDNFANEIDNAWSAMGSLIFWPTFIKFLTRSSKFVVSLLRKENVKSKKQNENKTKNKNLKKNWNLDKNRNKMKIIENKMGNVK